MRIWKKGIIGVASAAVIATGAIAAFAANGTQPAPQPTTSVDVKGPCDEAEHANDPRCDGTQVPEDRPGAGVDGANDDGPNHDANDDNGGGNGANDDGPNHDANDDNGGVNGANDDGPNHDANDDNGGEDEHSGPSDSSGPGSGEDHPGSDGNSGPGSSSLGSGSSGGGD
jgi:hypothetical protein